MQHLACWGLEWVPEDVTESAVDINLRAVHLRHGVRRKIPLSRRYHHHVYVIELSSDVWLEPKFRRANPQYRPGLPCVYVGMTGLFPDERFDKHKAGIKANRYVRRYGLRLLPELYEVYNPMPYRAAQEMEVELGIGLREAGYGVWQG